MVVCWKVILTMLILYTIAANGNRARRRRQVQMPNPGANSIQPPMPPGGPNPQILNAPPGQFPPQQGGQNDMPAGKQGSKQYYYPYQGQTGYYGGGLNYPYGGAGLGAYQYGSAGYGGGYYNQYPGSNSFYPSSYGGGGGYYNRPGYSNYYPSSGGGMYGGYYWNAGHKQNVNLFTVLLSSLLTLVIYLITA